MGAKAKKQNRTITMYTDRPHISEMAEYDLETDCKEILNEKAAREDI
jgi:hypothetical protein